MSAIRFIACAVLATITGFAVGVGTGRLWTQLAVSCSLIMLVVLTDGICQSVTSRKDGEK